MTRRTTRIAALGVGTAISLGLGFLSAAPAGASDGTQASATVSAQAGEVQLTADAADAINKTLGLVNQACAEATEVAGAGVNQAGSTADNVQGDAAEILGSEHGISLASGAAGSTLNLNVSLPALTDSLPVLGSLPLVGGSVANQLQAVQPLQISCATAADGAGLGLSAAGVDVLVSAIAPGIDVSELDADLPAVGVSTSVTTASADPAASVSASAAASIPVAGQVNATGPSARVSAAAPGTSTTTSAAADVAAEPASTSVAGGTLARTGAGVGALGLLGSALFGGGRLLAFGRKFLRIG